MDHAPAGSSATLNEAEPGEQAPRSRAAGNRGTGAGNGPGTSLSERMKHFVPSRLAKPTASVCRACLLPPRGLPSALWSHDLDTFGRTAVNISRPHIASGHTFEIRMHSLPHYVGNAANLGKFVSVARSRARPGLPGNLVCICCL